MPAGTVGFDEEVRTPEMATAVGLLAYAQRNAWAGGQSFAGRQIFERVTGTMRRWVSELF